MNASVLSSGNIRERRSRDGGDEQRCDGGHGEVHHQHLQGEDESGDGRLEDSAHCSGGTATDHEHHRLLVKAESFRQVRTDGGTGQHDWCLSSDRTTETDGQTRTDNRRPHVMRLDNRLALRDSIEDFRDTVRDIVPHYVFHEKGG